MIESPALPFSQASENNKRPILEVLNRHLPGRQSLLEIGGGTGQHAEFFTGHFHQLRWQSSDVPANIASLNRRIALTQRQNLPAAITIDVNQAAWCHGDFDVIYTANSLHIMPESAVANFFRGVDRHLQASGILLVYGPFRYRGDFTTPSNANFDGWLKARDPRSGIRDFEWVEELAREAGCVLLEDNAMPANNQLLVWQRSSQD